MAKPSGEDIARRIVVEDENEHFQKKTEEYEALVAKYAAEAGAPDTEAFRRFLETRTLLSKPVFNIANAKNAVDAILRIVEQAGAGKRAHTVSAAGTRLSPSVLSRAVAAASNIAVERTEVGKDGTFLTVYFGGYIDPDRRVREMAEAELVAMDKAEAAYVEDLARFKLRREKLHSVLKQ
jgi:hypothetical protein